MTATEIVPAANGRLLVLDDDAQLGEAVRRIAEASGFETLVAADAYALPDILASWEPTHIVLDLRMPGIDGMEVIAELSRRGCQAMLIIASGVGDEILAAAARSATEHGLHMGSILAKPFTMTAFRAALLVPLVPLSDTGAKRASDSLGQDAHEVDGSPALGIERDLEMVVEEVGLGIALQPKVRCDTGEVDGFEALVRWKHSALGNIPPASFLPVATRMGLMDRITDQVLAHAATWLLGLDESPGRAMTVAVNVPTALVSEGVRSAEGIQSFEDWADGRCRALGLAPDQIVFEVTETDAMADSVTSLDALTRLRVKGFHLSIDDFGTGYSSLSRLARLPFSELKIDRSFVMDAVAADSSAAIVRAAIDLAHGLRLTCVAEGVEDAATLDLLRALGCDLAQGYHVARPMTPDDATAWLARNSTILRAG